MYVEKCLSWMKLSDDYNPWLVIIPMQYYWMIIEYHWSLKIIDHLWKYVAQKQRYENMKISRPETMSGKIQHLENICENISLRNRGKVYPYK